MTTAQKTKITVKATVHEPMEMVWEYFTNPKHIIHWNSASPDWHSPSAKNDLRPGGSFITRMEAKDGSAGFDFEGKYQEVERHSHLAYILSDGREVQVTFREVPDGVEITEVFDPDPDHPAETQKNGWQAILDSFKTYTQSEAKLVRLNFQIEIDNTPEEVYRLMLERPSYEEWTDEFSPGSTYIGNWDEGSTLHFVSQGEEGNQNGMISKVIKHLPAKHLEIEHVGILNDGVEILEGKDVEMWKGAHEKYTFKEIEAGTLLLIETDSTMEYDEYFSKTWPIALQKLKEICERKGEK
ncbi:SRPBCC family protein [Algoriphagus halophytocola]|uniref:SRPBCC family protein n=1 Tax=Algoriphagus halophytocola TaxID=2991499 RepID=UPI0029F55F96|nr:SRPBCC family protein [Algoriphagus sp. TR-M5]